MLRIQIENEGTGEVIDEFNFPETIKEVKLSQFTAFEARLSRYNDWLKTMEGTPVDDPGFVRELAERSVDLVSSFIETDAGRYPLGNWKEHIERMMDGSEFQVNSIEANVFNLLGNIYALVSKYQGKLDHTKPFTFTHKGETFQMRPAVRDVITKAKQFKNIESARVIEALKRHESYLKNVKSDENGDHFFTSLLYAIACFAQKKGDRFPSTQSDIETFLSERVMFFQDIDLETGMNAASFFLRTSNALETIKNSVGFGIHLDALERVSKQSKQLHRQD